MGYSKITEYMGPELRKSAERHMCVINGWVIMAAMRINKIIQRSVQNARHRGTGMVPEGGWWGGVVSVTEMIEGRRKLSKQCVRKPRKEPREGWG